MTTNHQSPYESLPPLSQKQLNTTTWGSGGNTMTITDSKIHPNSDVSIKAYGSVPQAGFWIQSTPGQGTITVTSSDSESSTLAIQYVVY